MDMQPETTTRSSIKSAILILAGGLLFGITLGKTISQYQQDNFVLDEVVPISDGTEDTPLTFLDPGSDEYVEVDQTEIEENAIAYAEDQINGEKETVESYYARVPLHIAIPSIGMDSEITLAGLRDVEAFGKNYQQWLVPDDTVGWHYKSAVLGKPGNTVLNGHHNALGQVFINLHQVKEGDEVIIRSRDSEFHYQVVSILILPERWQSEEVRLENARWIQHSENERVTLITCWPHDSNTHRLIVVAYPLGEPSPLGNETATGNQPLLANPLESN